VPIDPVYPGERILHIVTQLGPVLCLTETALAEGAERLFGSTRAMVLDASWADVTAWPDAPIPPDESGVGPADLAYVIYTSGTSGRPKGVMAEHRHVTRFMGAFNEVCGTTAEDRVYQGFSLSFDGSVEEIWMAFSNGSTLVVPTRDAPRFGAELGQYLTDRAVTYFSTVPTLLGTIPDDVPLPAHRRAQRRVCPLGARRPVGSARSAAPERVRPDRGDGEHDGGGVLPRSSRDDRASAERLRDAHRRREPAAGAAR
jgi:non-ribosomal peptide synthetase component F